MKEVDRGEREVDAIQKYLKLAGKWDVDFPKEAQNIVHIQIM